MRDHLERLQTISEEQEDYDPEFCGPEYDVDKVTLSQQAIIFENSSAIDDVLSEAHSIRKEISMLSLEVKRLSGHNDRYRTSTSRLTLLKRDSDCIARAIQKRGESLHARLEALGKEKSQLEEKEGTSSAVSRIARLQYDTLNHDFRAAMCAYSEAEEKQKITCRNRIQRQASIMGNNISDKQLDVLVDKGGEGWTELSQSLNSQRSCRLALCDIRTRHKELVDLEARLKDIHELFLQMAILVEEQGSILNNVEYNVCNSQEYVDKFNYHIKRAVQYKRKNPLLHCCPCLPCWRN
ncbi:syntaxin-11-like [Cololabis saira]|uniref:syntaxin-11-like n=1 Tax=Cololabis saira TaxID=129043 RepID=UPI002AD45CA0|nr:syntaxin-11-like [Cololabis saira]